MQPLTTKLLAMRATDANWAPEYVRNRVHMGGFGRSARC